MGCPVHSEYEEYGKVKVEGLSSEKETSNILKNDEDKWEYPSEGQLYKALIKKHENVDKKDMNQILHIHNTVNELAWQKVLSFEKYRSNNQPKLSQFQGTPSYMTPKAFWNHYFLGYKKPFDVHIWKVTQDNNDIEYYLDFYTGKYSSKFNSVYVDVRPRINSFSGLKLRVMHGYYSVIDKWFK
eukprot:NODE_43_length_28809_cov_0.237200.p14 type:complete len:184 gc:universal NODE_43_length_28809_cov_0.237200:22054-21503(-)